MPQYQAIFLKIDGLLETDVGPFYILEATTHDEAEDEALNLPRPEGSNFIKLLRDGQYEGPKLGFAL